MTIRECHPERRYVILNAAAVIPTPLLSFRTPYCHSDPPTVIPNGVRNLRSAAEDGIFLDDPACGKDFRFFVVRSSE